MSIHPVARRIWSWGIVPALVAVPLSLFVTFAALEHNPQEEFCVYVTSPSDGNYTTNSSPCRIKWGKTGLVFGMWFTWQMVIFTVVHVLWTNRKP